MVGRKFKSDFSVFQMKSIPGPVFFNPPAPAALSQSQCSLFFNLCPLAWRLYRVGYILKRAVVHDEVRRPLRLVNWSAPSSKVIGERLGQKFPPKLAYEKFIVTHREIFTKLILCTVCRNVSSLRTFLGVSVWAGDQQTEENYLSGDEATTIYKSRVSFRM